jgi:anti-sigma factor RsiW
MKNRHVTHELSAYLDGEARHGERIARHLEQCDECAAHYHELVMLSSQLKALPAPEVRPEFATRVMAHVRDTAPAAEPGLQRWLVSAAAVSLVLVFAAAWLVHNRTADVLDSWLVRGVEMAPVVPGAEPALEESWGSIEVVAGGPAAGIEEEDLLLQLVAPIGEVDWSTPLVQAWAPAPDLDAILLALNEEEIDYFLALLAQYVGENAS